jgi:hypothetical protein
MRKIHVLIAFVLLPTIFFGQASVLDKFDGLDGVESVLVTKKMFQMMGNVKMDENDKEMQKYIDLTKKLDDLKVFTTLNSKMKANLSAANDSYIVSAGLEALMPVKDGTRSIRVSVKSAEKESQIRELLMFVEDSGPSNKTILLSLTGNFDLNELSVLMDKMNLPGGNALKKIRRGGK